LREPARLIKFPHERAPIESMYLTRRFLLVLAVLAATSPLLADWGNGGGAEWYRPQILWLGIIAAVTLAMYRDTRDVD